SRPVGTIRAALTAPLPPGPVTGLWGVPAPSGVCSAPSAWSSSDPEYRGTFLERIRDQGERLHALILDLLRRWATASGKTTPAPRVLLGPLGRRPARGTCGGQVRQLPGRDRLGRVPQPGEPAGLFLPDARDLPEIRLPARGDLADRLPRRLLRHGPGGARAHR